LNYLSKSKQGKLKEKHPEISLSAVKLLKTENKKISKQLQKATQFR